MRKGDWETALAEYIELVRDRPHEYGKHDCMLFVAGAVKVLTGKSLAAKHKGKYHDKESAAAYLKTLGFKTPAQMIDANLKRKPIGFAQRGDIVLTPDGIPGVSMGEFAVIVGTDGVSEGLGRVPRELWTKAWSVE